MLISDNGSQFVGKKLKWFLEVLHTEHRFAPVRNAHTNGQVEVTNKVLLDGLKKRVGVMVGNWSMNWRTTCGPFRPHRKSPLVKHPFALFMV